MQRRLITGTMLLTRRVQGSGIDRRTVSAAWMCGVHDRAVQAANRRKMNREGKAMMVMLTCREVVGLSASLKLESQASSTTHAYGWFP